MEAEMTSMFKKSPAAIEIELPDLDSNADSEIRPDNIRAKAALEYSHAMESLKSIPSSDKNSKETTRSKLTASTAKEAKPFIGKQQIQSAGKELAAALPDLVRKSQSDPDKLLKSVQDQSVEIATNYGVLGSMGDGDIMALAFVVIMEAAKSAQEDLKEIMEKVKNINQSKADLREALQKMQHRRAKKKDDDD